MKNTISKISPAMKKKVYLVQPSYRKMDRTVVTGSSMIINCTLNVPMLLPCIPSGWEKCACLENFDPIDYNTDASVVFLSTTSSDIVHCYHVAKKFHDRGKVVFYGGHQETLSLEIMPEVCDAIYYGIPDHAWVRKMLDDALAGDVKPEYHCGVNFDFPFDYSVFRGKKLNHLIVTGSVGCKYRCDYCQHQVQYDGHYKLRDLDCIMEDLHSIREYTRIAAFRDANFCLERQHTLDICRCMKNEGLKMLWGAQCPIHIGKDEALLHEMYEAGCRALFIGYESLDQGNLDMVHKPARAETYLELTRQIRKAGIHVIGYFMFGFDFDTVSTFWEVYDFVKQSGIAVPLLNLYTPIPGTRMYDRLDEQQRVRLPKSKDFVAEDILFSIPCSKCHFLPAMADPCEMEEGFLELYRRLTALPEIFRRSMTTHPFEMLMLLKMNLNMRYERKRLEAASACNLEQF